MGVVQGVSATEWPTQGKWMHKRVEVCFHYDINKTIGGMIVRDDMEKPFETIIRLDDGRFIRSCECMYSATTPARGERGGG